MERFLVASAIFVLLACGCSSSDCARYAEHVADITTRGLTGADLESRRVTVVTAARQACENGRVSPDAIRCVLDATTTREIAACELGR